MDFESGFDNFTHANASLLSFEQNDNSMYNFDPRLMENFYCFDTAASNWNFLINNNTKEKHESRSQDAAGSILKRPHKWENIPAMKKQCTDTAASTSAAKKPKEKTSVPSKDPQSTAAKNRRERVSERLKILQELVPNGSKVDMVTMLEKAIGYVKFLQLQVKVLATDEFWPVEGGKAPDISQVRKALDAILSSQIDRNSSSI